MLLWAHNRGIKEQGKCSEPCNSKAQGIHFDLNLSGMWPVYTVHRNTETLEGSLPLGSILRLFAFFRTQVIDYKQ